MNKKTVIKIIVISALIILAVLAWEFFAPKSFTQKTEVLYNVQKGAKGSEIASDLAQKGIIKNDWFFKLYSFISGKYGKLQAGIYSLSPSMSIAGIVNAFSSGDTAKTKLTIIEGQNINDIGKYLESKQVGTQKEFLELTKKDFSADFAFLKYKPKNVSLEGYLFPDTYYITPGQTAENMVRQALANFDKKLTPKMREDAAKQKRTLFQVVTVASILEKEVKSPEDKKIVAGILWKRLDNGMPLQVDASINYITGKSQSAATVIDKAIDSPYNTYKYAGLPKGPISNPGIDSLIAAIYAKKTAYWYYLSAKKTGETIFSKTFHDHTLAIAKYL